MKTLFRKIFPNHQTKCLASPILLFTTLQENYLIILNSKTSLKQKNRAQSEIASLIFGYMEQKLLRTSVQQMQYNMMNTFFDLGEASSDRAISGNHLFSSQTEAFFIPKTIKKELKLLMHKKIESKPSAQILKLQHQRLNTILIWFLTSESKSKLYLIPLDPNRQSLPN